MGSIFRRRLVSPRRHDIVLTQVTHSHSERHNISCTNFCVRPNINRGMNDICVPIEIRILYLCQDPRVNRLEDSLLLWKAVTSNKLLANVNVVLFLNKCDLLQVRARYSCCVFCQTDCNGDKGQARCRSAAQSAHDLLRGQTK